MAVVITTKRGKQRIRQTTDTIQRGMGITQLATIRTQQLMLITQQSVGTSRHRTSTSGEALATTIGTTKCP